MNRRQILKFGFLGLCISLAWIPPKPRPRQENTRLYLSKETLADIKNWGVNYIDNITNAEICKTMKITPKTINSISIHRI